MDRGFSVFRILQNSRVLQVFFKSSCNYHNLVSPQNLLITLLVIAYIPAYPIEK